MRAASPRISSVPYATGLLSTRTSSCAATRRYAQLVRISSSLRRPLPVLMLFPGQSTLEFPTTCPSCEHTPLETDSCTPNKSLRNTMRVWLQKQKKKEEAKAVSQAATPAPSEVQPTGDAAEKSAEGLEGAPKSEDAPADEVVAAADDAGQALLRAGSTASQPNEVSRPCDFPLILRATRPTRRVRGIFGSVQMVPCK